MEIDRFGIARSMLKSIVFPKPWQRGHAPAGLLKLNRIGSGSRYSMLQNLQANFSLNRWRSPSPAFSKITSAASR